MRTRGARDDPPGAEGRRHPCFDQQVVSVFEVLRRTFFYYRPVKSALKVRELLVRPIKAMIVENSSAEVIQHGIHAIDSLSRLGNT